MSRSLQSQQTVFLTLFGNGAATYLFDEVDSSVGVTEMPRRRCFVAAAQRFILPRGSESFKMNLLTTTLEKYPFVVLLEHRLPFKKTGPALTRISATSKFN
jgi:hypothetical protein